MRPLALLLAATLESALSAEAPRVSPVRHALEQVASDRAALKRRAEIVERSETGDRAFRASRGYLVSPEAK